MFFHIVVIYIYIYIYIYHVYIYILCIYIYHIIYIPHFRVDMILTSYELPATLFGVKVIFNKGVQTFWSFAMLKASFQLMLNFLCHYVFIIHDHKFFWCIL